jgi:DNA-binding GntR family transcriptional regulator
MPKVSRINNVEAQAGLKVAQAAEHRGTSRAEIVSNWIMDGIAHGRIRPGEWLSENELAETLNLSRSPVREGLRSLVADGLVEVYPRRGHCVAALDARDVDNIYGARLLIEPEAVRLAVAGGLVESSTEIIYQRLEELREAQNDAGAYFVSNAKLQHEILKSCPNSTLADLTETLWRRSTRFRSIILRLPDQLAQSLANHERLVEACVARDARLAQEVTMHMLVTSRRRLLTELFIDTGGGIGEMISRDVSV